MWFQDNTHSNPPIQVMDGNLVCAQRTSFEHENGVMNITKEAYAQAKQGQLLAALSLLEQHESTYRNELDFWKCYIHCLSKFCKQESCNFANNEEWWIAFEQRMQMIVHNSAEACNHRSWDGVLSGNNSFDQYILRSLNTLYNLREQHFVSPQQGALLQQAQLAANSKDGLALS